jgi:hypothetical protein
MFISECVFVYMPPQQSADITRWFTESFDNLVGLSYEMIALGDSFGKVMITNLKARNIELHGLPANSSLDSQAQRFLDAGFTRSTARDLRTVRDKDIPKSELQRYKHFFFSLSLSLPTAIDLTRIMSRLVYHALRCSTKWKSSISYWHTIASLGHQSRHPKTSLRT